MKQELILAMQFMFCLLWDQVEVNAFAVLLILDDTVEQDTL